MKKKIGRRARVILATTLACASLMGIGGTLAYLNATSNSLTNTFVAGTSVETLELDEHVATYDNGDYVFAYSEADGSITSDLLSTIEDDGTLLTYAGVQTYSGVLPGSDIAKDPTLTWEWKDEGTSAEHYVYIEVYDTLTSANTVEDTYYNGDGELVDAYAVSYEMAAGVDGLIWKPVTEFAGQQVNFRGPNSLTGDTMVYVLCDENGDAVKVDADTAYTSVGFIEDSTVSIEGFYVDAEGNPVYTTNDRDAQMVHVETVVDGSLQFWGYMCQAGTFEQPYEAFTSVFTTWDQDGTTPTSNWAPAATN